MPTDVNKDLKINVKNRSVCMGYPKLSLKKIEFADIKLSNS